MAELTRQSLKLPSFNKFRISEGLTARSRNFTNRSMDNPENDQKQSGRYSKSTPKYPQTENFKKALLKIGAYPKEDFRIHFVPDEQEHQIFRRKVLDQLKSKYLQDICEEEKAQPYRDQEMDQAALGCWKYGKSNTRRSIWKRYRQNLNQLNYETMRLAKKKGVF